VRTFTIECGLGRPAGPDAVALALAGPGKNVNLRIDYISRRMVADVPDLLLDLLELAAYVYCADQVLGRGSTLLTEYGASWRRNLRFVIAVRQPDVWRSEAVRSSLSNTLSFLSDDNYEFTFVDAVRPPLAVDAYFPNLEAPDSDAEVALFSGGLDSFAGVAEEVATNGGSLTLVSHYASTKVKSVQSSLIDALNDRGFQKQLTYIPVWVNKEGLRDVEPTQRTRSFLFACLGLVIAQMSRKDRFTFYENGVVSINPSMAGDILGGRATRTTHPRVIRGLETFFSSLLDRTIEIRTPLQWLTKAEVVEKLAVAGLEDLLASTVSCTRTRTWTRQKRHCGLCSQCIDRRFAVLAAGMGQYDPIEGYRVELMTGDRSADREERMALCYVAFYRRIAGMTRQKFLVDVPEVASALGNFSDLSADEAGSRIFEMLQRQATIVEKVITDAVREHSQGLYRGDVATGTLLASCMNHTNVEPVPASNYDRQLREFLDRLEAPVLEFAFDAHERRVLFRAGVRLEGASFRVVDALIGAFRTAKSRQAQVPFLPAPELAARAGMSEPSLRQQIRRVRNAIEPLTVAFGVSLDQDSFIENKEREGYRLNPQCREMSAADIVDSPHAAAE
jgi:hypothetical protein